MTLKNRILSLTAAVLLVSPAVAFADDGIRYDVNGRYDGSGLDLGLGIHIHTSSCRHDAPAPPPPRAEPAPSGRYELRTVQRWSPGYTEQVWVAEQCTTRHKNNGKHGKHGHKHKTVTVCSPGYYANRWIEGRYVDEQQWVWVETTPRRHVSFHAAR